MKVVIKIILIMIMMINLSIAKHLLFFQDHGPDETGWRRQFDKISFILANVKRIHPNGGAIGRIYTGLETNEQNHCKHTNLDVLVSSFT